MTRMNIGRDFAVIMLLGAVLVGLPSVSAAQFTFQNYETWRDPAGAPNLKVRSDRWIGNDFGGQEARRELELTPGGVPVLFLRMRQQGQTTDNVGVTFFANNSLQFARPETLTRAQAKFRILEASISSHCPANTTNSTELNAAVITWTVFNDGSSTGPGDRTGDHNANIRAFRRANLVDPPGLFRVQGFVCRCSTATCNTNQCSGSNDFASVVIGQKFTLEIIHDPVGASDAKFLVSLVGQANSTFGYPSTTPVNPAHNPAVGRFGAVQTNGFGVDCTIASGGPKEVDVKTHVFPKIRTNPEAVIP